ncbi:hypothetical protein [Streptomyces sp. NPDC002845]
MTPSAREQGTGGEPSAQSTQSALRREQSGIALNSPYSIDLDSQADNWAVERYRVDGNDLYLNGGLNNERIAVVTGQTPEPGTCDQQTRFSSGISSSELKDGMELCARTSGGTVVLGHRHRRDRRWCRRHPRHPGVELTRRSGRAGSEPGGA